MTPTAPSPTDWLVRLAGDPNPRPLDAAAKVLEGIRDGDWEPSDEVRGPGERLWRPIEEHPTFADAVAEMGPPPVEPPDETTLDMNPLIDVALVLLIFFILTATVATLSRTIDVPPPQSDEGSKSVSVPEIEDRIFTVTVTLDERGEPVVQVGEKGIVFDQIEEELKNVVKSTGRKEMLLKMHEQVTWDVQVKIQGAAAKADIRAVHIPSGKKK